MSASVLTAADFRDADLFGANLQKSDLENADFSGADLRGVLLRGANLSRARLINVDLRDGALMYAGDDASTVVNHVDYSGIELARISQTPLVICQFEPETSSRGCFAEPGDGLDCR